MADGGFVVCLILLMAAIGFAIFGTVAVYCAATTNDSETRFKKQARLFVATANIGNAITHALITVYLLGNSSSDDVMIQKEIAAGYAPLIVLGVINLGVGLASLFAVTKWPAICWNTFVIFAGVLVPAVWPRFLIEGFVSWPLILIFLWLGIFLFELTAVVSSWLWFALLTTTNSKTLL
mmetsp:Transcript_13550/g.27511  ORF Transcript_13550/g.27511 Transcript_13550/m.27511 type:complete len:179 (+) Transcript_13550:22-558(+)